MDGAARPNEDTATPAAKEEEPPLKKEASSARVMPPVKVPGLAASVEKAAVEKATAIEAEATNAEHGAAKVAESIDNTVLGKARAAAGKAVDNVEEEVADQYEEVTSDNTIWIALGALVLGFASVVLYCACQQPRDRPWGMPPKRQY